MSDPEGRRVYLARNSIRRNVTANGGAYAVSYALAATRGARIVSHNLEGPFGSVSAGLVRPEIAAKIVGHLVAAREGTLDELLKNTGYVPNRPNRTEPVLQVLKQGETTYATCYDSDNNWYTVATGVAAAERMSQDDEPAPSLLNRLGVPAEDLPDDLKDLTVITAEDELFPIVHNYDGTYDRREAADWPVGRGSRRVAREVNNSETRLSYLNYLGGVGLGVYHEQLAAGDSYTPDEISYLGDAFAICRNSLKEFASY